MKKMYMAVVCLFCLVMLIGCEKKQIEQISTEQITEVVAQKEKKEVSSEVDEGISVEHVGRTETTDKRHNILIAIDPGHQGPNVDMSAEEPNAPGSFDMKQKATSGTTGKYTNVPEYQLNLDISLLLKESLESQGYQVLLTREDNDTAISNAQRAQMANEAGADISIRIHANGSEDAKANGALVLIGSQSNGNVGHLYDESLKLGNSVLSFYCAETGMKNLGVQTNDTMTGINWSQIPVIILEMGFMSNETDDRNMQDFDYQEKMIAGITKGINAYYGFDDGDSGTKQSTEDLSALELILQNIVNQECQKGNSMSVCVKKVDTGDQVTVANDSTKGISLEKKRMKAASLIKLYIAGSVYENMELLKSQETYVDETRELVSSMLRISDNNAANILTSRLGNGNSEKGIEMVNAYCKKHGFHDTSMERIMLDFNSGKENYTSALDCTKFLGMVLQEKLQGSGEIIKSLKQQERIGKLPAGIPQGIVTANKTGELEDVENDAAIIYASGGTYIVTVMMSDLCDTVAARQTIVEMSKQLYEYMEK